MIQEIHEFEQHSRIPASKQEPCPNSPANEFSFSAAILYSIMPRRTSNQWYNVFFVEYHVMRIESFFLFLDIPRRIRSIKEWSIRHCPKNPTILEQRDRWYCFLSLHSNQGNNRRQCVGPDSEHNFFGPVASLSMLIYSGRGACGLSSTWWLFDDDVLYKLFFKVCYKSVTV